MESGAKEEQDRVRDEAEDVVEEVHRSEDAIRACIKQIAELKGDFVRRCAKAEEADELKKKEHRKLQTERNLQMREAFAEAVALSKCSAEAELDADRDKDTLDEMSKVHKELHKQLEELLGQADKASAPTREVGPADADERRQVRPEERANEEAADSSNTRSESSTGAANDGRTDQYGHGQEEKCKRRRLGKKSPCEDEWVCAVYG